MSIDQEVTLYLRGLKLKTGEAVRAEVIASASMDTDFPDQLSQDFDDIKGKLQNAKTNICFHDEFQAEDLLEEKSYSRLRREVFQALYDACSSQLRN